MLLVHFWRSAKEKIFQALRYFAHWQKERHSALSSIFWRPAEEEVFDGFRIFEKSTSTSSIVHSESGAERFLRRDKKGDIFTDCFCFCVSGARQSKGSEIYQGDERK
jgi:hypothetical protein